ncbi:mitochondrial protein [Talaromyces stipitatus ATCC 10500]|uniref:Mitochondrial distribution and morphology protein 10 n=1 Tax=Talaromyces stipitatus (strain ATCC 10500 / CBS 375.48 / QM 6759 / NRRL 1006) TaxID=441959 RepID=MDM10_TALSN|nr:mitochondrial protein [Talaromyces stipitatus ATCC 10500]B8LYF6.1 RecName: Full=Mitochondrial distribution and morphology protein 10; AltName: Full=Mitochondrial inheritance component mdm10 [Talaromyces stipitatus ATCC 10500]EED22885.1 mitochondrial protein [Talaromyces stipitatus ATCC 10500]
MLEFMDYVQLAFAEATRWNQDNSYSSLTAIAESLLDFHVPERLQVHLSSLSTPHFATSYTLGTVGLIDGSVSYLFSTVPLNNTPSQSGVIPLRRLVRGYRQIEAPVPPIRNWGWDAIPSHDSSQIIDSADINQDDIVRKATLLHATLHLPPPSTLNALFQRRISPTTQITAALVSTQGPPLIKSAPSAALLAQISHDTGTFSNEYLFSTDNALFGWRGLWNIGLDPSPGKQSTDKVSLLSAGAEAYYSPISSLVGLSTGLKFTTLPAAGRALSSSSSSSPGSNPSPISSFPYTLTLTLTPLTGSLSTTYSARASPNLAFSSRFGFNVYSWESEMVAGCEIWRKSPRTQPAEADDGLDWARRKMGIVKERAAEKISALSSSSSTPQAVEESEGDSVVKIRVDQSWNVRLLWEGRVKSLLVTAGVSLGPGTFTALSSGPASPTSSSAPVAMAGAPPTSRPSYWQGVGVSILYSS